jgi:hypothetical protein
VTPDMPVANYLRLPDPGMALFSGSFILLIPQ